MTSYNIDNIRNMIQKDLTISRQLLSLLKQETPSIQQRNYAAVKDILLNKAPLLDQLKKHSDIRKEWLLSLYKVADKNQWHDFLYSFNDPEVISQWEEVNHNIEECKTINDSNGIMITRGKNTYTKLLQLLKGGTETAELYNAKGSRQSKAYHCSVTKA